MLQAVIDTNILVSGFISPHSFPKEIERRWRDGQFILCTSPAIIEEVNYTLHSPRIQVKYRLAESDIQAFLLTLNYQATCVIDTLLLSGVAPDSGDDKIISCAVVAKAEYIVTGDKKLLQFGEYRSIKIINAESFIEILDNELK